MELSVLKSTGEDTGRKVNLPEEICSIDPNDHVSYLDVKSYLANQRQGTHLSYKAQDNGLVVLEDFNFDKPSTKAYLNLLGALSLSGKKTLLVLPANNKNVVLSGRNIQDAKSTTASDMNTYDLLNADYVMLSEGSVSIIENLLK